MPYLDQLKELCRLNGIHVSGTKATLEERLRGKNIDPESASTLPRHSAPTPELNWLPLTSEEAKTLPNITQQYIVNNFGSGRLKRAKSYFHSHEWVRKVQYVKQGDDILVRAKMTHSMTPSEKHLGGRALFKTSGGIEFSCEVGCHYSIVALMCVGKLQGNSMFPKDQRHLTTEKMRSFFKKGIRPHKYGSAEVIQLHLAKEIQQDSAQTEDLLVM